jgi:hypothetical protein
MSDVIVTLDPGQFNLLISGLGLAASTANATNFETRELIGHPEEYSALSDHLQAQLPGAARARIAVREGLACPVLARSHGGLALSRCTRT